MRKIVIIKKPDILRTELVNVLREKLPMHEVTYYHPEGIEKSLIKRDLPSVIIIDIDMVPEGISLINTCLEQDIKVAVWTSRLNNNLIDLFKLGLSGYFIHEMESDEFALAINEILQDRRYVHSLLSSVLFEDYLKFVQVTPEKPHDLLTHREWDILGLIVSGDQTDQIATHLQISAKTVTNHVTSILRKLEVPDRTNAVLLALRRGWFVL